MKEKLLKRKSALEDRLYKEQLASHQKINNLGWGYGMRSYHSLKTMSFSKEDRIKEQIKEVNAKISALCATP